MTTPKIERDYMAKKVAKPETTEETFTGGCILKKLPDDLLVEAANKAVEENPTNAPQLEAMPAHLIAMAADPQNLAVLTGKRWKTNGVILGVSFLDSPDVETRNLILSHMNAWSEFCNAKFSWSQSGGQVRIDRSPETGYASYLGTDILLIPKGDPTMWLEGFTSRTRESEYRRVVRHETGHTLGFPHEHLRRQLVDLLDPEKTIIYFRVHYGWSEETTRDNVLLPLEEWAIMGTPEADATSIMTYELSGEITKSGKPIQGGLDLSPMDKTFSGKLYPLPAPPPVNSIDLILPPGIQPGKYTLKLGG